MARVVIPACPHHVTQRGNRHEDVFFTEADRLRYLKLLADYAAKHGLAVQVGRVLRPQKGGRPRKPKPRRPTPHKRRKHG